MRRANIRVYGNDYRGYIIIESMKELSEYFEESLNGIQKDSIKKLMDRAFTRARGGSVGHTTDHLIDIAEVEADTLGCGVMISHAKIFGEIRTGFIKVISRGEILIINPQNGLSHFGFKKSEPHKIEIISTGNSYTKEDIKIYRWPQGSHWYAKVAQLDVVINGEQKWNTKQMAEENAIKFLELL